MSRLYRPSVPVEVKCRVALRQLGELWPDDVINANRPNPSTRRSLGGLLEKLLPRLAELLGCDRADLRLDHDPPLAARPQERRGLGRKTYYVPDANDPEHLFYRPHGPEFTGSHLIKTNVRGDHGQYPDRVLIKRERRRKDKRKRRPKTKIKQRKGFKWPTRRFRRRRVNPGAAPTPTRR